jgi:hypothetical protein
MYLSVIDKFFIDKGNKEIDIKTNFLYCVYKSKIYLDDFSNYDYFEEYNKNKKYEKMRYINDYGYGKKEYENILYIENKFNNVKKDKYIYYVVAKEIFNKKELKRLEKYCECENCIEIKKYNKLNIFEKIVEFIINKLIVILRYLYSCLKINDKHTVSLNGVGCYGCIKDDMDSDNTDIIINARNKMLSKTKEKMIKTKERMIKK